MNKLVWKLTLLVSTFLCTGPAHAESFVQSAKLTTSDRIAGDQLGSSVAVSGNYAIAGSADVSDGQIINAGGWAYVYEKNNSGSWVQVQKLVPADKDGQDDFGYTVAISGNCALVGSPRHDRNATGADPQNDAGAVYVYVRNPSGKWTQVQKLTASDRSAGDRFGTSVSVQGNHAVIGAPFDSEDAAGSNSLSGAGSVYVFSRSTDGIWTQAQKIAAPDRSANDGFGSAVSVFGKYLVAGAPFDSEDSSGANTLEAAGSAYIFEKAAGNTWIPVHKINALDRGSGDQFGYSVSIHGEAVIVGAPFEDEDANFGNTRMSSGSAYVFERKSDNRWWWVAKLIASDRANGDTFGESVSISGDMAVVGAPIEDEDESGSNTKSASGSVYIFNLFKTPRESGWREIQKLGASDRNDNDWFGYSVAISENTIFAGSPMQDLDASSSGSVNEAGACYVFEPKRPGIWKFSRKIFSSDRDISDHFGQSVSISGKYAIVGVPLEDQDAKGVAPLNDAGAAYIYERQPDSTWKLQQKLVASDRAAGDNFGYSVGISGSYAIAGAIYDSENARGDSTIHRAGSAYIFECDAGGNWSQKQKITLQLRQEEDMFGYSVSISGNFAAVGIPGYSRDSAGNINAIGGVAVFERVGGTWIIRKELISEDRVLGDGMGASVCIQGNLIIAGAAGQEYDAMRENRLEEAGAAYIFERFGNTWNQTAKLVPKDRTAYDKFGYAVAIHGDHAVVGAWEITEDPDDENSEPFTGGAYIFSRNGDDWSETQKIIAPDIKARDRFGYSVAISGNTALIGCPHEDEDSEFKNTVADAGSVYVYEKKDGQWTYQQKLFAPDRITFQWVGGACAIDGDFAIAGSVSDYRGPDGSSEEYSNSGSAYIFVRVPKQK